MFRGVQRSTALPTVELPSMLQGMLQDEVPTPNVFNEFLLRGKYSVEELMSLSLFSLQQEHPTVPPSSWGDLNLLPDGAVDFSVIQLLASDKQLKLPKWGLYGRAVAERDQYAARLVCGAIVESECQFVVQTKVPPSLAQQCLALCTQRLNLATNEDGLLIEKRSLLTLHPCSPHRDCLGELTGAEYWSKKADKAVDKDTSLHTSPKKVRVLHAALVRQAHREMLECRRRWAEAANAASAYRCAGCVQSNTKCGLMLDAVRKLALCWQWFLRLSILKGLYYMPNDWAAAVVGTADTGGMHSRSWLRAHLSPRELSKDVLLRAAEQVCMHAHVVGWRASCQMLARVCP